MAGVSKSTVSRVLNHDPMVSAETRNRVLRVMQEQAYTPNGVARGLTTRQTGTIGLVLSDITNPFFPELARGVEDFASSRNYNVILCNTDGRPDKEGAAVRLLLEKRVDGILFASAKMRVVDFEPLVRSGVPYVMAGRTLPGAAVDYVSVDSVLGGEMAVEHLIRLGHRRIAFIGGPTEVSTHQERFEGYRTALARHGLRAEPELVVGGNFRQEGGFEAARRLLREVRPRPTALFAINDLTAIGAIDAAQEEGLRVPDDLAVVGFDDIPFARLGGIGLTTVAQPKYEIGSIAARILVERIGGQREPIQHVILPPRLVVRRTCGATQRQASTAGARP